MLLRVKVLVTQLICLGFIGVTISDNGSNEETLLIEVLHSPETCERKSKRGDLLTMHYKGSFIDGTEFDSSYTRNEPFQFQLGVNQVIQGWDDGLVDMCVGEKRRLTIPPHLGYGDAGAGDDIPPKSKLIFEVECMAIEDGTPTANIFKEIDANSDSLLSREEVSDYLIKQLPPMQESALKEFPYHDSLIEEIFHNEDTDRDGYITHNEFTGPKHDEL